MDTTIIEVPFVGKVASRPSPELMCELAAELRDPLGDGLERDIDATLGKQVFNVTQAQRKPIIEPHRIGDDLSRKAVAPVAGRWISDGKLCHRWRDAIG